MPNACNIAVKKKSELHFLLHGYALVTLITPPSEKLFVLSLLEVLDPHFLMRIH
jgi:hypothetical protein